MKNNILKYIAFGFLLGTTIISCNDDELAEAPRLFRPVASMIASQNNIILSWDLISDATNYDIGRRCHNDNRRTNPLCNSYR